MTSPNERVRMPAEWEKHSACWLACPSHPELWQDDFTTATEQFVAFARALVEAGEHLEVLVPDERRRTFAEAALGGLAARIHVIPFGDIWVRDTGPLFVAVTSGNEKPRLEARLFSFNGWGGKYQLDHDDKVGERIAARAGVVAKRFPFVLEGGALETDGEGTVLTTRQCLLRGNRNRGWTEAVAEKALGEALGFTKVLWLEDGLLNDHTDGHIDTIARFIGPARVVCMRATTNDDPNRAVLTAIERDLGTFRDAHDRAIEVCTIPSPGAVLDEDGEPMPASYLNFYLGNQGVVVPTYGVPQDDAAVKALAELFPNRRVIGTRAENILTGGGAFHCISQQQPEVR